jgi:PAS domain S-box-containing protein
MRRFFHSLTFKIGVIIILVEIIVLAVTGFFYINRFSAQVDERVRARIELPGKLVSRGLLTLGSVADEEVMTELVGAELIEGMVIGADKLVFNSLTPAYVRRRITEIPGIVPNWFDDDISDSLLIETGDSLVSITPVQVFDKDKSSFFILIEVETEQAAREKRAIVGLFLLGSLFTVVITSVAIIILFKSVIVARVNGVLDVLRLVEAGDLTSRIRDVISPDEIGGLQTGVNSMAAHLEATVGSLQQRVADLDQAKEVLQRWANIFKHAGWGVAVGEIDGSVMVLMNPAFASMHGYTLEELTGQPADRVFAPEVQTQLPELMATAQKQGVYTFESKHIRKDKSTFPALINVTNVKDENDDLLYRIFNVQDITELKRAESALAAYASELERSNRELEEFANIAAHDLQEPLRKVQAFGDRIVTKYHDDLDEQGRDYLGRMQHAAARMQTLINDLLSFSRVTTKAQPYTPVDLTKVAQEVLSDLETHVEDVEAQVTLAELPTIDADGLQMRQLLQNLISNALKFHEPGRTPHVTIEGKLLNDDKQTKGLCQISVADDGIGFDEKYLDRIFTVFQRLHGRNEYEGTGVGLAVCRKIVERHGGTLTATSSPGQGATFIVTLPAKQVNDQAYP